MIAYLLFTKKWQKNNGKQSLHFSHRPIVWGWGRGKEKKKREKEEQGDHRNGQKYCSSTSFFKNRFLLVKLMLICSSWLCRAHFKLSNDVFHFIPWAIQTHFSHWFFQTTSLPRLPPPNNHKPSSCCWLFYVTARIGPLLLMLTSSIYTVFII